MLLLSIKYSTTVKGAKAMNVRNSPGARVKAEAMVTSVTRFVEGEMQREREEIIDKKYKIRGKKRAFLPIILHHQKLIYVR